MFKYSNNANKSILLSEKYWLKLFYAMIYRQIWIFSMLSALKNMTQNKMTPWRELMRSKIHFMICNTTFVSSYIIKIHPTQCKIQVIPNKKNIFTTVLCLGFVRFLESFWVGAELDAVLFVVELVVIKGMFLALQKIKFTND